MDSMRPIYSAFVQATIPSVLDNIRAVTDNMTVAMGLRRLVTMLEDEEKGKRHLEEFVRMTPALREIWVVWDRQVSGSDHDVSAALLGALSALLQHPRAQGSKDAVGRLMDEVAFEIVSKRTKALLFHVGSGDKARTNNALTLLRAVALRSPAHARRLALAIDWSHAAFAKAAKYTLAKDSEGTDIEAAYTGAATSQRLPRANLTLLVLTLLQACDVATLEAVVAPGKLTSLVLGDLASDPRGIILDVLSVLRSSVLSNPLLPAWCKAAVFTDRTLQQLALAAGQFAASEAREDAMEDEGSDAEGQVSVSRECAALLKQALSDPSLGIAPLSDRHVVSALQPAGSPQYCSMGGAAPLRLVVNSQSSADSLGAPEEDESFTSTRVGPSLRGYLEAASASLDSEASASAAGPRRVMRVLEKLQPLTFPIHAEVIMEVVRPLPSLALAYLQALPYPLDYGANEAEKNLTAAEFTAQLLAVANGSEGVAWSEYVTLSKSRDEGLVLECDLKAFVARVLPAPFSRQLLTRLLLSKSDEVRTGALTLLNAVLRSTMRALQHLQQAVAAQLQLCEKAEDGKLQGVSFTALYRAIATAVEQRLRPRLPDIQSVLSCCSTAVEKSQPASDAVDDLLLASAPAQREAELALRCLGGFASLLPTATADAHFDPLRLVPSFLRLPAPVKAAGAMLAAEHAAAAGPGLSSITQQGLGALLQLASSSQGTDIATSATVARLVASGCFDSCSSSAGHPRGAEAWVWVDSWTEASRCLPGAAEFLASFLADTAVQTLKRPQELYRFVQHAAQEAPAASSADFSLFALAALRQAFKVASAKSVPSESKFAAAVYVALSLRLLRAAQPAHSLLDASLVQVVRSESGEEARKEEDGAPPSSKKAKKGDATADSVSVPLPVPLQALVSELKAGAKGLGQEASEAILERLEGKKSSAAKCIAAVASGLLPSSKVLDALAPASAIEAATAGKDEAPLDVAALEPLSWMLPAVLCANEEVEEPALATRLAGSAAARLSALAASPSPLSGHRAASAAHFLSGLASSVASTTLSWKASLFLAVARSTSTADALTALTSHTSFLRPRSAATEPVSTKKRKADADQGSPSSSMSQVLGIESLSSLDSASALLRVSAAGAEAGALLQALSSRAAQLLDPSVPSDDLTLRALAKLLPLVSLEDQTLAVAAVDRARSVLEKQLDGPRLAFVCAVLASVCPPEGPETAELANAFFESFTDLSAVTAGRVLFGSEALLRRAAARSPLVLAACLTHASALMDACLQGAASPVSKEGKVPLGLTLGSAALLELLVTQSPGAASGFAESVGPFLSGLRDADRGIYRQSLALLLPSAAACPVSAALSAAFYEPLAAYFSAKPILATRAMLPAECASLMARHGPLLLSKLRTIEDPSALLGRLCAADNWSLLTADTPSCTCGERLDAVQHLLDGLRAQGGASEASLHHLLQAAGALAGTKAFAASPDLAASTVARLLGLLTRFLPLLPGVVSCSLDVTTLSDLVQELTKSTLKRHMGHAKVLAALGDLWEALLALSTGALSVEGVQGGVNQGKAGAKRASESGSGSSDSDSDSDSSSSDDSTSSDDDDDSESGDDAAGGAGTLRPPHSALKVALGNLSAEFVSLIPSHSHFGPLLSSARAAKPHSDVQLQAAACINLFALFAQHATKRSAVSPLAASLLPVLALLHGATTSPLDRALRNAIAALQPPFAAGSSFVFGPFAAAVVEAFPSLSLSEASIEERKLAFARAAPTSVHLLQASASSSHHLHDPVASLAVSYDVPWVTRFLSAAVAEGTLTAPTVITSGLLAVLFRALGWPDAELRGLALSALRKIVAEYSGMYAGLVAEAQRRSRAHDASKKKKTPKDTRPAIFLLFDFVSKSGLLKEVQEVARLPNVVAVFLAHAVLSLVFGDDSPLFGPSRPLLPRKTLERYLRRKQELEPSDVPMLYALLASGSKDQKTDRIAACRLLGAALQDASDLEPARRRYALELVTCLVGSGTLCQPAPALAGFSAVLEIVRRVPSVVSDLAGRTGLTPWLASQISDLLDVHVAARRGVADSVASSLAVNGLGCLEEVARGSHEGRYPKAFLPSLAHARGLLRGKLAGKARVELPDAVWEAAERL